MEPVRAPCPVYNLPGPLRQTGEAHGGAGARNLQWLAALGGAVPRLSSDAADSVARAKKYAMEQSIRMVLMKQTLAHQQQQMASQRTLVQRQQALALMCRVYVGSISFELKEDTIRQAFLPFGPIKSINMSWDPVTQKHKGFAFVEYEIPEAAQLSLEQMNGVMLGGRNIKVVGRPSNMPQAQAVIDEIQDEAKRYNRVYVASVHPELTETDIQNVFEAFGAITSCRLASGGGAPARHKGYGFIEYATLPAALEAIQGMNLFDLGGQHLRVTRAITPPHGPPAPPPAAGAAQLPAAAAVAAAAATAKIQAMDAVATSAVAIGLSKLSALGVPAAAALPSLAAVLPGASIVLPAPSVVVPAPGSQAALQQKLLEAEPDTLQHQETLSISGQSARQLVMQRLMRRRPSRVLLLRNMAASHEVDAALHHEIQEECSKKKKLATLPQSHLTVSGDEVKDEKYTHRKELAVHRILPEHITAEAWGPVERLVIYNERADAESVKVFVQFAEESAATAAAAALNGRYFAGRTVQATLYDQELFDHGDLTA